MAFCPTWKLCGAAVEIVTVKPFAVPPPEVARPEIGFVYVNVVAVGTDVTVKVPL